MAVYNKCGYWLDLGTPGKYLKVHKDILKGLVPIGNYDFGQNRTYISKVLKLTGAQNKRAGIHW